MTPPTPLTDEELTQLAATSPMAARAVAEIRAARIELATPSDERAELHWSRGYSAALTGILNHVLSGLGYQDTEATRAKWILEREGAVRALRGVCRDFGDNDWDPDLHLADVIEKHLHRQLEEAADEHEDEIDPDEGGEDEDDSDQEGADR